MGAGLSGCELNKAASSASFRERLDRGWLPAQIAIGFVLESQLASFRERFDRGWLPAQIAIGFVLESQLASFRERFDRVWLPAQIAIGFVAHVTSLVGGEDGLW